MTNNRPAAASTGTRTHRPATANSTGTPADRPAVAQVPRPHTVLEGLARRPSSFSVEFFPPRGEQGEQRLWRAVREAERLDPAFVSVTYGAGGSTRERTIQTTARIRQHTDLCTMAHLAAVDHSTAELRHVLSWYAAIEVRNLLLVRGDPPGDPMGPWTPHPDGITYTEELVRLTRDLGDFCIGVAAFPYGHPRSADPDTDLTHLVRKIRAGADFAISQLFFAADDFLRLRDRLAARRCHVPLLPGLMPLTTQKVLHKAVELAGVAAPPKLAGELLRHSADPAALRAAGIDAAVRLGDRLLREGVPALHFYTLNNASTTRSVVAALGLGRPAAALTKGT
jgi:methylenetetrahydrofolate reductase (NADPH)